MGYGALDSLTTADFTTAVGRGAGSNVTNGRFNTFYGYNAGGNSNASHVVAIGYNVYGSGASNKSYGVYIGSNAGRYDTSGEATIAIGYNAVACDSGGGNNPSSCIGIGNSALNGITGQARSNIGIGGSALSNVTNGEYNTAMGQSVGSTLTTGDNNVLIGYNADVSAAAGTNQIVIGQGATGVGDNTAIIGNSSVTDVYMGDNGSTWSTTSDGRLKENVEDWNVGLDAINNLRIVSYNFKKDNPYKYNSDKKRQGIIAQEAQKVLPEMIKDDGEWLSANQEPMIWALVNSVKELSKKVEEQQKEIEELKKK